MSIDATPLASEQITQEDEALAALCVPNALIFADDYSHILDARRRASQHIARHRIAALSATPAPSDQDASQAQGEVEEALQCLESFPSDPREVEGRITALGASRLDAAIAVLRAALSPAPGAMAQVKELTND